MKEFSFILIQVLRKLNAVLIIWKNFPSLASHDVVLHLAIMGNLTLLQSKSLLLAVILESLLGAVFTSH